MNNYIFFLFLSFSSIAFCQQDTIRIYKNDKKIYKCTAENALSWYLYFYENECILADLKINPNEAKDWFIRFSNSQNLYRAFCLQGTTDFINFKKINDPSDTLVFKILEFTESNVKLEMSVTKEVFEFRALKV